jgi:hypothetical protein
VNFFLAHRTQWQQRRRSRGPTANVSQRVAGCVGHGFTGSTLVRCRIMRSSLVSRILQHSACLRVCQLVPCCCVRAVCLCVPACPVSAGVPVGGGGRLSAHARRWWGWPLRMRTSLAASWRSCCSREATKPQRLSRWPSSRPRGWPLARIPRHHHMHACC